MSRMHCFQLTVCLFSLLISVSQSNKNHENTFSIYFMPTFRSVYCEINFSALKYNNSNWKQHEINRKDVFLILFDCEPEKNKLNVKKFKHSPSCVAM